MIVTRIGNPSRAGLRAVYAKGDGGKSERVATLNDQSLADLGIEPGVAWTAALAARATETAGVLLARRDALRMVGRRAISRQRLIDRLKRKGHAGATAAAVADDVAARGLIDDAAYAATVAGAASRRAGRRMVESKLRARGIDRQTAAKASSDAAKERDAAADALALAAGRLRRMSDRLTPDAKRRRLYGLLTRRGYDADVCRGVIERLLRPGSED